MLGVTGRSGGDRTTLIDCSARGDESQPAEVTPASLAMRREFSAAWPFLQIGAMLNDRSAFG